MSLPTRHIDHAGSAFSRKTAKPFDQFTASNRSIESRSPTQAYRLFRNTAYSGILPIPEYLAEQFGGRACGGMFDLFVGYDERLIAKSSRDYATFQTPFGALRLVTLPMGWTNSVPIFHDDVD